MKHELLSPAGDMRAVIAAVQNGANAVYMGGKSFGARAFAANFSLDELKQAIAYAHLYGVKVYVTVNTLVFENETNAFLHHTEQVCTAGADALIMQDMGMIAAVRRYFPDIAIHASTQMHNHNDAALAFVKSLGASRAVLAREMSLKQIQSLTTDIEKEAFIHGALCICYSGQCLFSALTNGRSGNRGTCAQNCRMRYRLRDNTGQVYETRGEYLLSPKDIGLFEDIAPLLDAGVISLKIEGRMKSPEYVGLVTKIYAGLLRNYEAGQPLKPEAADMEDLRALFNRGYTKGHLRSVKGEALMSKDRPNHRGTPLGRVSAVRNGHIALQLVAPLRQGDGIKFERIDDGFVCNKVYKNGLLTACASAGETVELDAKANVRPGDAVVKTMDSALTDRLSNAGERRVRITGKLTAKVGQPLTLQFHDEDDHEVHAIGDAVAESRTRPITRDELHASIAKLGDTPYTLTALDIEADGQIFIAKSALNALRREAAQALTQARTAVRPLRVNRDASMKAAPVCEPGEPLLHVLVRDAQQFDAVKSLVTGDIYTDNESLYFQNKAAFPNLRLRTDRAADSPKTYAGERLLVTDHGGLFAYANGNNIVTDHSVYATNADAVAVLASLDIERITFAAETDADMAADIVHAYHQKNGGLPPLEVVLYARHELMVMRHCVQGGALGKKACELCAKRPFCLEDIKGASYPVRKGEGCHSRVFHAKVTEQEPHAYLRMGLRHFRAELFDEDAAQSQRIIKKCLRMIGEKIDDDI